MVLVRTEALMKQTWCDFDSKAPRSHQTRSVKAATNLKWIPLIVSEQCALCNRVWNDKTFFVVYHYTQHTTHYTIGCCKLSANSENYNLQGAPFLHVALQKPILKLFSTFFLQLDTFFSLFLFVSLHFIRNLAFPMFPTTYQINWSDSASWLSPKKKKKILYYLAPSNTWCADGSAVFIHTNIFERIRLRDTQDIGEREIKFNSYLWSSSQVQNGNCVILLFG